jgi:hypothetical protein
MGIRSRLFRIKNTEKNLVWIYKDASPSCSTEDLRASVDGIF